ncbi:MAG TPA: hypothetical protein VGY56_11325 [Verrucomicrobiae bacterium]|nr:hypothetical protein [Verrucomicrobiae bacterium]
MKAVRKAVLVPVAKIFYASRVIGALKREPRNGNSTVAVNRYIPKLVLDKRSTVKNGHDTSS